MRCAWRRARLALVSASLGTYWMLACTLTVDLEPLQNEDCGDEAKLCRDECVTLNNPNTGCGDDDCTPCGLPHASSICDSTHTCAVGACLGSFRDCDSKPANGCEIDIDHDADHCGSCTADPCEVENAVPDCARGRCAIRSCNLGFGDCNENASDGCETDLKVNRDHCSVCKKACAEGETCNDGTCG